MAGPPAAPRPACRCSSLLYVLAQRRRRPVGRPLLEPDPHPRRAAAVVVPAPPPAVRAVRRSPSPAWPSPSPGRSSSPACPTNQTTIILTIDVSGSMCSTDIPPSRLQAAEAAATQFIESQGSGTQIGIVAFTGFAEIVQAPTTDQQLLFDALQQPHDRPPDGGRQRDPRRDRRDRGDRPERRQELDRGLARPAAGAGAQGRLRARTSSSCSPTARATPASLPTDAAQQAADRGIRVYTIGFGTANGGGTRPGLRPVPRRPRAARRRWRRLRRRRLRRRRRPGGFRRGIDEDTLKQVADADRRRVLPGRERRAARRASSQGLPTNLITKHEVVEIGVGFVGVRRAAAAALALLLGRAWRPLP